jgi:hypothetical protein
MAQAESTNVKLSDRVLSYLEWGADIALLLAVVGVVRLSLVDGHDLPYPLWPWSPMLGLGGVIAKVVATSWRRNRGVALATLAMTALEGALCYWFWCRVDMSAIDGGMDLGSVLGAAVLSFAMVWAYWTYMMVAIAELNAGREDKPSSTVGTDCSSS